MNFNLRILILALIFVSAVVPSAIAQKPQVEKTDAAKPQTTQELNLDELIFPDVEGWKRGGKIALPTEESGIIVNYDSLTGVGKMTIYVYKRGKVSSNLSGVVKDEFDGAKDAIRTLAEMGMYTDVKEIKSETAFVGDTNGKTKSLHAQFTFKMRGESMASEIYVFSHKDHIVKLRLTRPADAAKDASSKLLGSIDSMFSK